MAARRAAPRSISKETLLDSEALIECLVAAILTVAATDTAGTTAKGVANRYSRVLHELRDNGGVINPPRHS